MHGCVLELAGNIEMVQSLRKQVPMTAVYIMTHINVINAEARALRDSSVISECANRLEQRST